MNKHYDYVIVGGGPTGLTLALYLSKYHKKVAILEKEETLGGCHSVKRINGLFTEHGPRVYLDNYLVFRDLLQNELHVFFEDLFTKYKYGKTDVFNTLFGILSLREFSLLSMAFLNLNDSYKTISFGDFLDKHQFSTKSKDILDRIGRLTDGGGIEQYTLFSFLQIMNQNILYDTYEPRKPNDVGLFKIWTDELVKRGVHIFPGAEVNHIQTTQDSVESITTKEYRFYGTHFIFAMPPFQINKIFNQNHLESGFREDFNEWSNQTNYITYIPVMFHWNKKIHVPPKWGYPQTSWGVGFIVMSDYMEFDDPRSVTVISTVITIHNKSEYLNKTPDEVPDKEDLMNEVFRQLRTVLKDIPDYDHAIMSQNRHDGEKWIPVHTAFMTTKYGYIDFHSNIYRNLYNCGVQNGKSSYSFTSLESSIVNAVELVHEFIPESRRDVKVKEAVTFRFVLFVFLSILLICIVVSIVFVFYRRERRTRR